MKYKCEITAFLLVSAHRLHRTDQNNRDRRLLLQDVTFDIGTDELTLDHAHKYTHIAIDLLGSGYD